MSFNSTMSPNGHNNSNVCMTIQDKWPDMIDDQTVQFVFAAIYLCILFTSCSGNLLVLIGLVKHRHCFNGLRKVYIANLTVSDLILAVISLPISSIQAFARVWPFGPFLCSFFPIIQSSATFSTSFTLVAIAIDRYSRINAKKGGTPRSKSKRRASAHRTRIGWRSVAVTLGIWVVSLVLTLPYGFVVQELTSPGICGVFCDEIWHSNLTIHRQLQFSYGITVFFVQFWLPLILCCCFYLAIFVRIRRQSIHRKRSERLSQTTRHRIRTRKRRIIRMMSLMLVAFIVAWLPIHVLNVLRDSGNIGILPRGTFAVVFVTAHTIAMSSTCWNPIIYSFCNREFRNMLRGATSASRVNSQRILASRGASSNGRMAVAVSPQRTNSAVSGIQQRLELPVAQFRNRSCVWSFLFGKSTRYISPASSGDADALVVAKFNNEDTSYIPPSFYIHDDDDESEAANNSDGGDVLL